MIYVNGVPTDPFAVVPDLDAYNREANDLRRELGVQNGPHLTIVETDILDPFGRVPAREYFRRLSNGEYPTSPHGEEPGLGKQNEEFWRRHDEFSHFGNAVTAHPLTVKWVMKFAELGLEKEDDNEWGAASDIADALDSILGTGFLSSLLMSSGTIILKDGSCEESRRYMTQRLPAIDGLTVEEVDRISLEYEQPHRQKVVEYLTHQRVRQLYNFYRYD